MMSYQGKLPEDTRVEVKKTPCGGRRRNTHGAGLVEGVVGLALVVGGVVAGTMLLINVGISTYYKEKLGFISNQAAYYAAGLDPKEDINSKTKDFAKELMSKMGLVSPGLQVTADLSTVGGKQAATVTISALDLPLFGRGSILPANLSLKDTATAVKGMGGSSSTPTAGYLIVHAGNGSMAGVVVPVLGTANTLGASDSDFSEALTSSKKPVLQINTRLTGDQVEIFTMPASGI